MPETRLAHLHPLRWLGQRDRGFAALRRATRAAIIMPAMFALGDKVIGNPQVATFAAFGSFAMLLLVDFGGPMAERLQAQHHGVVALVSRCEALKLVKRKASDTDRRQVEVHLLKTGEKLLARLAELHRAELRSLTSSFRVPQIDL